MRFNKLLFRVSYINMLIWTVSLLLLANISFSDASAISQSSLSGGSFTSTQARKDSSSERDYTIEIDKLSVRLNLLEQQISLLNSKNEKQEKDIDFTKKKPINYKEDEDNIILQLKNRLEDLEAKLSSSVSKEIEERMSHILGPINAKIKEQTQQINKIFVELGKKSDDNSSLASIDSKDDQVTKECRGSSSPISSPAPTYGTVTPSTLRTSTVKVSTLKSTTPAKKRPNFPASSEHRKCEYSRQSNEVNCEEVPNENIKEFFQRTDLINNDKLLNAVNIDLLSEDEIVPADILGNKKTENLVIRFDFIRHPNALLKVDANAFQSTKNYTKNVKFMNFNSSQLDLGFLSGFNQLTHLSFDGVFNILKGLSTLPLLPKLTEMRLDHVRGLDDSTTFPTLSSSDLKNFRLIYYDGKEADTLVSRMMDWILTSSAKTLEILELREIRITKIPTQIPSFTALRHLDLGSNSISTVKNGTLSFSVPVSHLELNKNKINLIEPAAFQGDFSNAYVDLFSNRLIRIDESAFRPLLEQMVSGTGKISIFKNPIGCTYICDLAWILLDSKLKAKVAGGRCHDGSFLHFDDLVNNGLVNHCRVTKKP